MKLDWFPTWLIILSIKVHHWMHLKRREEYLFPELSWIQEVGDIKCRDAGGFSGLVNDHT